MINKLHNLYCCILALMITFWSGTDIYATTIKMQQDQKVKGIIVDEKGEVIIGATIQVIDSHERTVTNMDGEFTIAVPQNSYLTVSYIGYETQKIAIGKQKLLRIVLKEENTLLNEVVVVGYGTMKRKEMTSAISHVSAKDLNQISSLDASMLLQGKVSSVSVSNTALANPNSTGSIQIRGISSRNASLSPLIVIDGIPGGDLTNINPADIESIDVLKDGAASAIYGTRGSNGVILVNLKKGSKDGQIHTTYSTSVTFNKVKNELDIMNAEQYRAYCIPSNPLNDLGSSTDWFDEITRLGVTHMHTLTLSGGTARTNYRLTVDYRNAEGVDLRSDRREYGARASINHTTKDGLFTFSANISPRDIKRQVAANVFTGAIQNNPTVPVYDPKEKNGYYRFPSGSGLYNIVERLTEEQDDTEIDILEWNASAGVNLLPLFNPQNPNMVLKSQITVSQYKVDKLIGTFTPSTYGPNVNAGIDGKAKRSFAKSSDTNLEWITNFSTRIKNHQIRAMLGYSYMYGVSQGFDAENWNFDSDALGYNNLGAGLYASIEGKTMMGSSKSDHKLISFFGRVNYDWKERYMLTFSLRHEGSSRFGKNHKWGNFPAFSLGWRISDEKFMDSISWIDDLKIRYDYGMTGNQEIGNYKSLATYQAFGWYQYNGNSFHVWGPSKNVNSELRWEQGRNQNIGLDFSLFKNRISGSLNYYIRKQEDLLGNYNVPTPPNLYSTIYANVGTLRNTGFEFDITANLIRMKDFTWNMTVVGATNNNKFVSFSNDIYKGQSYYSTCEMANPNNPGYLQRIEEGQRIGNYFTYRYAGVDKEGDWMVYNKDGKAISIAEATEDDKSITGNGLPKFTGSMTHNFVYKNFDLTIALRGACGFDIFNVHDFYYGLQSGTTNLLTTAFSKNAHIKKGINILSDYFIEPGDYLKIDNITLGYTLDIKKKYIDRIRIFGTANNLYTFTKFSGVDPSTYQINGLTPGTFGGNANYYPSAFQFILGLQVNF
ncbi:MULTISPECIES: SusC/RagA family TonB-linked outer membrane protein [Bacteroides]|mgnify:FL=1|jgi:TonB-linked SusC/RagA family outer membrane protein|uniref:SusC/RagA family TonB-linked outer membrane protein n=2 Tax=Bacteroides TaxID=816 RepID=UPI00117E14D0|nr:MULTISPECIES: SusC/RagA family TonB-linked outer membrane protein [Bacteroides]